MNAVLGGITGTIGDKLPGILRSSYFRCFVVFALGGLCGRVFDAWTERRARNRKAEKGCGGHLSLTSLEPEQIQPTDECTVCLDLLAPKYTKEECACLPCVRLVCGHAFHKDCIEKWLARDKRQSCPVCRMDAKTQDEGLRRRSFWGRGEK